MTQRIAALLARVESLSAREWVIAVGVALLCLAIAAIGRSFGRIRDELVLEQARLRRAEESIARIDDALAKRMRNLEARQDRLQLRVEHQGRDWRDSMRVTESRASGEFDLTQFDLKKP